MLWILYIASVSFFGYTIFGYLRVSHLDFIPRIFSGYLLGTLLVGILLHITTYILPISSFHSLIYFVSSIIGSVFLMKRSKKSQIVWITEPSFLFLSLFVVGVSMKYLSKIYGGLPEKMPYLMIPIYDDEISFINSLMKGVNKRRLNPFFFDDPRMSKYKYSGNTIPLLFISSCISLGGSYENVSAVLCLLNVLATVIITYLIFKKYTNQPTIACLLYLFSGSWAAYLFFKPNRIMINNDLVHQISSNHLSIWYHNFGFFLTMSKSASFSIALSLFAVFYNSSIVGVIFTSLIPNNATSFATFAVTFGMSNDIKYLIGYFLTLIYKIYPFLICYKPMFREAEMRGIFYAPFIIWFLALGPVFIIVFSFIWFIPKDKLKIYLLSSFCPFLILQFIREGHDHFSNSLAIMATFIPVIMIIFTEILSRFTKYPKDEENQGIAIFISTALIGFLLFGGYICIKRSIPLSINNRYDNEDNNLIQEILKSKKYGKKSVFLIKPRKLHPIIMTGRQVFMGDKGLMWQRGFKLRDKINQYELLVNESITNPKMWNNIGVDYIIEEPKNNFVFGFKKNVLYNSTKYIISKIIE